MPSCARSCFRAGGSGVQCLPYSAHLLARVFQIARIVDHKIRNFDLLFIRQLRGHAALHSLTLGYQLALYIAAGCVLLGLVVSPFLLRSDETPEEQKRHIAENMRNPETREHLIL